MSQFHQSTAAKHKRINSVAAMMLGLGLILLGLVAALILFSPDRATNTGWVPPETGQEGSVVPAKVDFPAPDLTLYDLNGQVSSLKDLRGNVILVNNWATWCTPCKAEMPDLQLFYERYKNQNFILIAIEAGDPEAEVVDFVKAYQLTFPVWLDPESNSLQAFGNSGLPNSYVIDRYGVVRLAWTGAVSLGILDKYIAPMLEE